MIKIKTYDQFGDYYEEMKRIYDQHTVSQGGYLDDNCIIDYIFEYVKEFNKKLYTACAFVDGKFAGFVILSDFFNDNELYIALIAVDEKYKRQGVGEALMNYAIIHSRGYDKITSNAFLKNSASVGLHLKLGFHISSEERFLEGEHAGDIYIYFSQQPPKATENLQNGDEIEVN